MTLKEGVTKRGVQPPIWYAIGCAEMIYRYITGHLLTVTSLTDSHETRPNSLHNTGLAADLRIRDLETGEISLVVRALKNVLEPQGFDVVLESDHIHIEFQPKAGESWIHFA